MLNPQERAAIITLIDRELTHKVRQINMANQPAVTGNIADTIKNVREIKAKLSASQQSLAASSAGLASSAQEVQRMAEAMEADNLEIHAALAEFSNGPPDP